MQQTGTKDRILILDGVAGTLNACGRTVVFSYDICASSLEKVYNVAKKPNEMVKNLLASQKCLLKSQESAQLLKEISMDEYKLNELYREFGKKSMDASDFVDPSASEEMQHLLADIKELRSKIDQLKERVVKLEGRETADLLLEREIRAYIQRTGRKAKRYKGDERKIFKAVRHAIDDAVAHGAFASESDWMSFQTVAGGLLDQEMDIKILAAAELGKMMCVAAINVLKEALRFNDPRLTTQIINSLITIGDIRSIPVFYEHLTNPHYRVRIEALLGLSKLADEEEVVSSLLEALKDGHPKVRMTAVTLLGWKKEFDSVLTLIACISDKDENVRTAVISALTHIGDRTALPALADLLGDKSREIRKKAFDAIKELSGKDIAFNLKAKGKKLRQAIEDVKLTFREMSVLRTPSEGLRESTSEVFEVKEPSRELAVEQEETVGRGVAESTSHATKRKRASRKTKKVSKPSTPQKMVLSGGKLKRMVKPQLLSLCRDLNIKCDISETKQQIIAKIRKRQKVKRK